MNFNFEECATDSPFIERIWRTQSDCAGTFLSRAVSHWKMVVWHHAGQTRMTVRGPETLAHPADCPAEAEFVGIQFKLGSFMPQLAPGQLLNSELELPTATSRTFWLHGAAWEYPTFDNADVFVARLARADMLAHDSLVNAVLNGDAPRRSARTVQYRFQRATGLSYKAIQQIERARHAEMLLNRGVSIADTIFAAGYADQPHLTRALKRLLGQTPAQLARLRS
jgi:hypothetical protein